MIVNCGKNMFINNFSIKQAYNITQLRPASEHYMSKVRSTLKQIVRDWSSEGLKTFFIFFFTFFFNYLKVQKKEIHVIVLF